MFLVFLLTLHFAFDGNRFSLGFFQNIAQPTGYRIFFFIRTREDEDRGSQM